MELGFETIGNACLICHDNGPVLATDTWLKGTAYFGSWVTSHEIPEEQLANVAACKYVWISHGHPDHLSIESLETLRDKQILLADHRGGRIARDLREMGFNVKVMKDGEWMQLSDNLRICCVADVFQDAVLLVELGGRLIVNSNDASDHGVLPFIKENVARFPENYLLCLTGYGDADMINFFDEAGNRIPPPAMKREPFLDGLEYQMELVGLRNYVPFSSQHRYQRADSVWANECATPPEVYATEFHSPERTLLPIFVHCDFKNDEVRPINPPARKPVALPPEDFGDNWSDELDDADRQALREYFGAFTHLKTFLGFVNFRVGGKDNYVDVEREKFDRGVTFETPRASLMTAVQYQVFDDILIGNFAKTTLHGSWARQGTLGLYPDFNPFVTKYGDNGGARTPEELKAYFADYKRRGFFAIPDTEAGREDARALAPYL